MSEDLAIGAQDMPPGPVVREDSALRTDPKSFVVTGLAALRQAVVPAAAAFFALRDQGSLAIFAAIGAAALIFGLSTIGAFLRWRRFTYLVGQEDIRVESGILSRAARSIPFERIQDVSIEQALVPRLFGLVAVKFETGSGGGEDVTLAYLAEAEGERLRELVRAHRDAIDEQGTEGSAETDEPADAAAEGDVIFAMDTRRLFTFGVFEFSLAVFAVLAGLAQYADWFVDFEIWDPDLWRGFAEEQQGWFSGLGQISQIAGAIAGLIGLFVVGSATGLVRTFLRDWDFQLQFSPRGFRRRRGLLTRTDVVMPAHRVQAVEIGTRAVRYRFGWHSLKFVSLAQDMGASNHDVAPFATQDEMAPIIRKARFEPPSPDLVWTRTDHRYWLDSTIIEGGVMMLVAAVVAFLAGGLWPLIPLGIAALIGITHLYGWRVHAHALDTKQIYVRRGWLSPHLQIGQRVKLHSVAIRQGPIAQRRGYANLQLGLAGGEMSISGLSLARAQEMKRAILDSIAALDFSEINRAK